MKITLFTKNKIRHNYLINLLSSFADKIFVVQESLANISSKTSTRNQISSVISDYFENVKNAELKLFGNPDVNNSKKNVKILPIPYGDLNNYSTKLPPDFLNSDLYVIFGSSYIRNELLEFLIKQKAINIHAGVSPFYRGVDCNFWAMYDNNFHLVGTTIHLLSKEIDGGPIINHAMSNIKTNRYEYAMSAIKSAFNSICERIKDNSLHKIKPVSQDNSNEIRYSKRKDFNEEKLKIYLEKEIHLNNFKFDNSLLVKPYFYNE